MFIYAVYVKRVLRQVYADSGSYAHGGLLLFEVELPQTYRVSAGWAIPSVCTHRVLPVLAGGCRPFVPHKGIENRSKIAATGIPHSCEGALTSFGETVCARRG